MRKTSESIFKAATEVILESSPKAATFQTGLSGWVSRGGRFFGEGEEAERMARYDGATHGTCSACGGATYKCSSCCRECREKKDRESFMGRNAAIWDQEEPIYSEGMEVLFDDYEELIEWLCEWYENHGVIPGEEEMRLVLMTGEGFEELDESRWLDQFSDLDESITISRGMRAAMEWLNEEIRNVGNVAYYATKTRAIFDWEEVRADVKEEVSRR